MNGDGNDVLEYTIVSVALLLPSFEDKSFRVLQQSVTRNLIFGPNRGKLARPGKIGACIL